MAQFPFPHVIEMTYLLHNGTLEVRTKVTNNANLPMPLALGYHSFFQLTDAPRNQWRAAIPARTEWTVNEQLLPTGKTRSLTELIPTPTDFPLANRDFDNGFADLIRDRAGRATFLLTGKKQRLEIQFGPKFTTGEIYSPANAGFLCFEPMTAINNGLNLAHRGVYKELQSIAPGGACRAGELLDPAVRVLTTSPAPSSPPRTPTPHAPGRPVAPPATAHSTSTPLQTALPPAFDSPASATTPSANSSHRPD